MNEGCEAHSPILPDYVTLIYNNLLYFLAAVFLFSIDNVPEAPLLPWWQALLLFGLLIFVFDRLVSHLFRSPDTMRASGYFSAEKKLSIFAVASFTAALHLCDVKYYLAWMSIGGRIPALVNIGGLAIFMLFFSLIWRTARKNYGIVFGRHYSASAFVISNIKANLPIVIPWIVLSLCYDLTTFLPWLPLETILHSEWGDLIFFGIFLSFVILFFPPLVRRLWGCELIPEGPLRDHLTEFCAKQNFTSEYYYWPLFEGRVLTAGVMGMVPKLRYILITPALIETMTLEELDAVMAHEIGHVKRKHLLLYVFLIGSFSVFTGMLVEPVWIFFLSRDFFFSFIDKVDLSPQSILNIFFAVPLLLLLLLYFRYVFGYFLRNFERQADLNVFTAIGNCSSLISAFEKIAVISGNTRDQPSWHHFGIGERVDYLEKCEREPSWIERHNRKVRWSLIGYLLILLIGIGSIKQIPLEKLAAQSEAKYRVADLLQKIDPEADKSVWLRLMGNMLLNKKMEREALAAYEQALELEPSNPELLNNIAWLLLTSKELELRNPLRALTLARTAAMVQPSGHVFDTLATAYWANGFVEEAIFSEQQAILADPGLKVYYRSQAERFSKATYKESYEDPVPEEIQTKAVPSFGDGEG